MTDIAATVPSTWKESSEQQLGKIQLDMRRNDARRQQTELQETISFHKQYHEAVVRAGERIKEIEDKLEDKASIDTGLENGVLFEVGDILKTGSLYNVIPEVL